MGRRKKRKFNFGEVVPEVDSSVKRGIFIVLVFLLGILSLLSIFDLAGIFGRYFYQILKALFGWGFWTAPIILLLSGYLSLNNTRYRFENVNWTGVLLLVIGYSGFFHLFIGPEHFKEVLGQAVGGGYIGYGVAAPLYKVMGRWAAMVVTIALILTGLILMFNTSIENILAKLTLKGIREKLAWWGSKLSGREEEAGLEAEEDEEDEIEFEEKEIEAELEEDERGWQKDGQKKELAEQQAILASAEDQVGASEKKRTRKKYPKIDLPLSLLNDKSGKPTSGGDIKTNQEIIKKTLRNFGIEIEMGDVSIGPTVTQYTFRPAEGVKLSRIVGLGNDLALALAAHPIRIEAPIPGKSLVGIEVPNKKAALVPLKRVLETRSFKERKNNMYIALGQDVTGKAWLVDLTKLPHLLVAGATNSGKTVCLNSIIISLLYQNQPDELKLILVDPKRVEMPVYNGIPHLITPVITDIKKTINALKWTINEMDRRFHILSNAGKRNIQSYNMTHPYDKLPYLVFIIDELADLMSMAGAEVEAAVIRLAQMSRAVGIHLILATQRPSVDIITGLIKANIPGRIAFSVASLTDSRTILDSSGAEKLLGRGDMLFNSAQISKPKRLQGAYCSDEEIERVVDYLRQRTEPDYEEEVIEKAPTLGLGGVVMSEWTDEDELLGEARELVIEAGKASASYLQRRLRIGYARAARLLDILEDKGVVGPADGSKPREVLIKKGERSLTEQADELLAGAQAVAEPIEEDEAGPVIEEKNEGGDEIKVEEIGNELDELTEEGLEELADEQIEKKIEVEEENSNEEDEDLIKQENDKNKNQADDSLSDKYEF